MSTQTDAALADYELYIDGEWRPSRSGERFSAFNPSTGAKWATFAQANAADVDDAVAAARAAFTNPDWAALSRGRRAGLLRELARLIRASGPSLARLDSIDSGRIIRDTSAIAGVAANAIEYFAGWIDKVEGRIPPLEQNSLFNYVVREPLGVIGTIIPWNNPLAMLGFKIAPALAMGNTVVIKPSEHASATSLEFARLCGEAQIPPGVVNVVTGFAEPASALSAHPGVAKISFTGSSATGRAVARAAADQLTMTVLELGGKSANIVFPDADLEQAVSGALTVFAGTGQSCVAPSRLLVHESLHDVFVDALVKRVGEIRLGDALDESTEMGPVATQAQLERDSEFCARGISEGARLVIGGGRPKAEHLQAGWFFEPTIFVDVKPDMYIAQEEAFGPILSIMPFSTEEEAIGIANGTNYALAAGLWTQDLRRAHRVAAALDAGTVWVNTWRAISHSSPTGGNRDSGYGRENGPDVLWEMSRVRSIWFELSGAVADPFKWKS